MALFYLGLSLQVIPFSSVRSLFAQLWQSLVLTSASFSTDGLFSIHEPFNLLLYPRSVPLERVLTHLQALQRNP